MKLYKYLKCSDYSFDALAARKIWISSPSKFNDLFDCNFVGVGMSPMQRIEAEIIIRHRVNNNIDVRPDFSFFGCEWVDFVAAVQSDYKKIEELLSEIGVFCLSDVCDSNLMWAHYADQHAGFCIEYDIPGCIQDGIILPVSYSTRYPSLWLYDVVANPVKCLNEIISTKSIDWAYERERRLVLMDKRDLLIDNPFPISSIIFGARISDSNFKKIIDALNDDSISLKFAKKSNQEFKLEILDSKI